MIFEKLINGFRKGVKTIAHETKVFVTNIMIKNKIVTKKNQLKRALLSRFTIKQLNSIAAEKGVKFRGTDPVTGEKWIARTKAEKVRVLARHLSFEEVVKLAKRYKIAYKDILEELDRFKASLYEKYTKIKYEQNVSELLKVLDDFIPEPVRDEEELEKQLYQYLRAKFPWLKVQRQKRLQSLRIDLYVPPCGIELKIPRSSTHLQRLIGQVRDYSEYLDCLITLILDTGFVGNLSTYVSRLEEMGIIPIVKQGKIK